MNSLWIWIGFNLFVLMLLALDLGVPMIKTRGVPAAAGAAEMVHGWAQTWSEREFPA